MACTCGGQVLGAPEKVKVFFNSVPEDVLFIPAPCPECIGVMEAVLANSPLGSVVVIVPQGQG